MKHPEVRYEAPKNPYLFSIAERRRLSGPALRQFFKIIKRWQINAKDARLLIGGITSQRYRELSNRPKGRLLNQDQFFRVTSVIAIDKALHKLLSRRRADKWVGSPDGRPPGGTPLVNMIAGGPIRLWEWRLSLEKQVLESRDEERKA